MAQSQNSTNGRTILTGPAEASSPRTAKPNTLPLALGARIAFGARRATIASLARVSETTAAIYAERLFMTPRRHARPAWERDALAGARRTSILHDGCALPVWTWGSDELPAALLVHGWEGRGSQLASFVAPLRALGMRVVTFDAPGHGEAEAPREALIDHARAVNTVAAFAGDVRLLVAHSLGAAATLLATRFGLRAQAFALVSSPTSPADYVDGFCKAYGVTPEVREAMTARLVRRFDIPFDELDAHVDARALEAPMLVIHDVADREVPVTGSRSLAAVARDARLVETNGQGHRRILRAPEVLREVEEFAAAFALRTPRAATSMSFPATLDGELFCREQRWAS